MQVKTITYQRVLNLGNYESKRLELSAEVYDGDNTDEAIAGLVELVERKIREDQSQLIEDQLAVLREHRSELRKQIAQLEQELGQLQQGAAANPPESKPTEEPNPDDIPFEPGEAPTNGDASLTNEQINEYF